MKVSCSYCRTTIAIALDATKGEDRDERVATFKCPSCDSTTEVWLVTKRKSKGTRMKSHEAKQAALRAQKVSAVEADNSRIAQQLLAQPGCACVALREAERTRRGWGDPYERADGLVETGSTNGLPKPPTHRSGCPAKDHSIERAIAGEAP